MLEPERRAGLHLDSHTKVTVMFSMKSYQIQRVLLASVRGQHP